MSSLSNYWISVDVLILVVVTLATGNVSDQCRLDNGQCVYKVELVQGHCGGGGNSGLVGDNRETRHNNPIQSDSNKISDIERTLEHVKTEHSKMISELQNKIDQLSTGVVNEGGQAKTNTIHILPPDPQLDLKRNPASVRRVNIEGSRSHEFDDDDFLANEVAEVKDLGIPLDPNRTENSLLHELHEKFSRLRQELIEARRKLKDKETLLQRSRSQLNKTEESLRASNEALQTSQENLLKTEDKRKEMSKLLIKKNRETNVIRNKLKLCRKHVKTKDIQIWELDSDLSKLQEQLDECHEELKQVKLLLSRALIKYHDLNVRHENVSVQLNETKRELTEQRSRERVTSFCGFEDPELCGFVNENDTTHALQWLHWSEATPSHWTGPEGDHTCGDGKGHYMYVEATAQASDLKARLVSPHYRGQEEQCVEFYYHMYGRNIGTLNVILVVQNRSMHRPPTPVWRAYGNQGNVWTMARLSVPEDVALKGYQVVFEAFTAAGYAGDIAIDDIRVFASQCIGADSLSQWRTKKKNKRLDTMRGR